MSEEVVSSDSDYPGLEFSRRICCEGRCTCHFFENSKQRRNLHSVVGKLPKEKAIRQSKDGKGNSENGNELVHQQPRTHKRRSSTKEVPTKLIDSNVKEFYEFIMKKIKRQPGKTANKNSEKRTESSDLCGQNVQSDGSQADTLTCTPLSTVANQAALLYLLNSSNFSSHTETTATGPSLSSITNAVYMSQPVTINLMTPVQSTAMTRSSCGEIGADVIEKAMDLANLGDVTIDDCMQHPVANAALTLVSLGTVAGQLAHEVVIDENGTSTFINSPAVEEVSITVETDESSQMTQHNPSERERVTTPTPPGLVDTGGPPCRLFIDRNQGPKFREVITQTGGGQTEVVVAGTMTGEKALESALASTVKHVEMEKETEVKSSKKEVLDRVRDHQCDMCGKKFFTKHDLKRHTIIHSDARPFDCQTCKKSFRTPSELKLHMPIHREGTPYKCEFCGKEFRTKGCIKSHIKYHIGDKRHKCTVCDRAFVKSADLKRHVAAHRNEKNYKCNDCDSAFTRQDNLKAHMLLHSRESVVTCDLCNKEFINAVYLKRHMHIHKQAKKKPYECQWCPKTYEQLEGLRRHIRQHVGDEKFVCEHCAKKFITAIQLKRHLWLSHEQDSPYRRSIL